MELKFTLQYSNPHIIRQVAIPDKFTLQQLYRVICVCVNRETLGTDVKFLKNGVELEKTQQITQELFSSEARVICSCNDKTNNWEWRIEPVSESNQPSKDPNGTVPQLMRFQGIHIGDKAKNVVEFNSYANRWYEMEDQIVLQSLVNVKLKLVFAEAKSNQSDNTIKFAMLNSCLSAFSTMKVEDMKEIEKNLAMKHPASVSKSKRAQLIVNDYMEDPTVIRMVLEKLTVAEFDDFLKLYASDGELRTKQSEYGNYGTLLTYGLVSVSPVDYGRAVKICMSLELAMGARHFMNKSDKDEIRRRILARSVIDACISLYGFASYWHYNKLIESCYNKFFSSEQEQECWDVIVAMQQKGQERYAFSSTLKAFCKTMADQMWIIRQLDQGLETLPYYVPNADIIKQIQRCGASYPIVEYESFVEVVRQNCAYYEDPRRLAAQMLQACIEDESPRQVAESYKQLFPKRTVGVKSVGDALTKLNANIRRPKYYGHTKNEYSKLTGGKIK